jgi:hypothetical protein
MNIRRCLCGCVVVLFFVSMIAPVCAQDEAKAPAAPKIDELISSLGSEDPGERDKATEGLIAAGEDALPALRDATKSEDPEIKWRAEKIIRAIDGARKAADKTQDGGNNAPVVGGARIEMRGMGGQSVSISQDGNGRICVKVTEKKDGKDVTSTYEADSAAEFKKKHPEIAEEYGIGENGIGRLRFGGRLHVPGFGGDDEGEDGADVLGGGMQEHMKRFRQEHDRLMKQIEKMMDDLDSGFPGRVPGILGRGEADEDESNGRNEGEDDNASDGSRAPKQQSKQELGVTIEAVSPELKSQLDLQGDDGAVINSVEPGSIAEKAGLRQWDLVLAIDGNPVTNTWEFRRLVKGALAGEKFVIELIRKGQKQSLTVDVPNPAQPADKENGK